MDNHEKETKKAKKKLPLLAHAHTCSLDPDNEPFKSDIKVERLVSKKLRQRQKPEVPYLSFTSVPGNPPLKCPLPPETSPLLQKFYVNTTAVWWVTLLRPRGTPFRMQWQCWFVDIMLGFTWGNVREDHNVILLLKERGAGTEIDSDLIWGFYKPYCGTKNSPTEVCCTNSNSYYEMPQWRRALGKTSKIPHQMSKNYMFREDELLRFMLWYTEQNKYYFTIRQWLKCYLALGVGMPLAFDSKCKLNQ